MTGPAASPLRDRLAADEPAYGASVLTASATAVEALADTGLHYVWVDLEHTGPSPYDAERLADLVRAAEVAGLDLLVRVPEPNPKMVNKVVDAGADAVLVPRVESAADVRAAVAATRFEYDGGPGERGAPLARSTGWRGAADGFVERADGSVLVGAMVETRAAVEAIDDILSVPELGFAFVGPGDLSIDYGHPLDADADAVAEAVAHVRERAVNHDPALGCIAATPAAIRAAVDDGYRVIRVGVDTVAAARTFEQRVAAVEDDT